MVMSEAKLEPREEGTTWSWGYLGRAKNKVHQSCGERPGRMGELAEL